MTTYQQPPYQTTVMQPVVIQQQPIVIEVPVNSGRGRRLGRNGRYYYGPDWGKINPMPAFLQGGAELCGMALSGTVIFITSLLGLAMVFFFLIMLFSVNWDSRFSYDPILVPIIVLGLIGAPIAITALCLCCSAKKKYGQQQGSHPTNSSSGHVYSRPGQPAAEPQAVGVGSAPMVAPMMSGGVPTSTVYPPQSTVISYPTTTTSASYPTPTPYYPDQQSLQQPPPLQPGYNTAPGAQPYPGASPSAPEKAFQSEYTQQSAYAPPPAYG